MKKDEMEFRIYVVESVNSKLTTQGIMGKRTKTYFMKFFKSQIEKYKNEDFDIDKIVLISKILNLEKENYNIKEIYLKKITAKYNIEINIFNDLTTKNCINLSAFQNEIKKINYSFTENQIAELIQYSKLDELNELYTKITDDKCSPLGQFFDKKHDFENIEYLAKLFELEITTYEEYENNYEIINQRKKEQDESEQEELKFIKNYSFMDSQSAASFTEIERTLKLNIEKSEKKIIIANNNFEKNFIEFLKIKNVTIEIITSNKINTDENLETLKQHFKNCIIIENDIPYSLNNNPFCLIDDNTLLIGEYGFKNEENEISKCVIILKNHNELIDLFSKEYRNIKNKFGQYNVNIELNTVQKRFNLICECIDLKEFDVMSNQILKLKAIAIELQIPKLDRIIQLLGENNYKEAKSEIYSFDTNNILAIGQNFLLESLKLELKSLEIQIPVITNEIDDIIKIIHNYDNRYNIELAELTYKLLELNIEKLKRQYENDPTVFQLLQDAINEQNEFVASFKNRKVFTITKEKKQQMSDVYRKCCKMCHPDVVSIDFKDAAEKIFIKLKEAYDINDLETLKNIYEELQKGIFPKISDVYCAEDRLKTNISILRLKRNDLLNSVTELIVSEAYKIIKNIDNWNEHFTKIKERLKMQISILEKDLPGFSDN